MDAIAEETTNCRYCGKAVSRILVKRGKTEHPVCLPPKKACIQVDVACHSCGALTSVVQDTDGSRTCRTCLNQEQGRDEAKNIMETYYRELTAYHEQQDALEDQATEDVLFGQ